MPEFDYARKGWENRDTIGLGTLGATSLILAAYFGGRYLMETGHDNQSTYSGPDQPPPVPPTPTPDSFDTGFGIVTQNEAVHSGLIPVQSEGGVLGCRPATEPRASSDIAFKIAWGVDPSIGEVPPPGRYLILTEDKEQFIPWGRYHPVTGDVRNYLPKDGDYVCAAGTHYYNWGEPLIKDSSFYRQLDTEGTSYPHGPRAEICRITPEDFNPMNTVSWYKSAFPDHTTEFRNFDRFGNQVTRLVSPGDIACTPADNAAPTSHIPPENNGIDYSKVSKTDLRDHRSAIELQQTLAAREAGLTGENQFVVGQNTDARNGDEFLHARTPQAESHTVAASLPIFLGLYFAKLVTAGRMWLKNHRSGYKDVQQENWRMVNGAPTHAVAQ